MAVPPPTFASASGTWCTTSRTRSTVSLAAWLSGGALGVPSMKPLSPLMTGSVTPSIPLTSANAVRTSSTWSLFAMTTTGCPELAG